MSYSKVIPLFTPEADDADFMAVWSLWLGLRRGVGKKDAERAFVKALRRADFETILSGAERYAASQEGEDPKHICHLSTWLNGDRWEDQGPVVTKASMQSDFDQWCCDWVNKGRSLSLRRSDAEQFVKAMVKAGRIDSAAASKAGYL